MDLDRNFCEKSQFFHQLVKNELMAPVELKRTVWSDRERSKFDQIKEEMLEIGHNNVAINETDLFTLKLKFYVRIKRPKLGSRPSQM